VFAAFEFGDEGLRRLQAPSHGVLGPAGFVPRRNKNAFERKSRFCTPISSASCGSTGSGCDDHAALVTISPRRRGQLTNLISNQPPLPAI
jgi:hypothetical protein